MSLTTFMLILKRLLTIIGFNARGSLVHFDHFQEKYFNNEVSIRNNINVMPNDLNVVGSNLESKIIYAKDYKMK